MFTAFNYRHLGNLQHEQGFFDKGVSLQRKGLKIHLAMKDTLLIAHCYLRISVFFRESMDIDSAHFYSEKTIALSFYLNDQGYIARAYRNLAIIYLVSKDYTNSVLYFIKAIKIQEQYGSEREVAFTYSKYGLLLLQQKKYNKAIYYLKKSIKTTVQIKLLKNLPVLYENLELAQKGLGQYKNAVTITHLAYKRQIITTEKGILNLVNLYLSVGTPFKAAKIMTEEIKSGRISHTSKNWGLLANAWTQAQEFNSAIAALTTASTLHDKGSLHQQLGRIYIEQEKWSEAIKAFNQAIAKGGIKQQGETYILLGMSHYELDQPQLAKSTFLKAQKHPKTRETALQWLDYLDHSTAN